MHTIYIAASQGWKYSQCRSASFACPCYLHGRHRRDVKTKQTSANDGDGRNEVDVSYLIHDGDELAMANPKDHSGVPVSGRQGSLETEELRLHPQEVERLLLYFHVRQGGIVPIDELGPRLPLPQAPRSMESRRGHACVTMCGETLHGAIYCPDVMVCPKMKGRIDFQAGLSVFEERWIEWIRGIYEGSETRVWSA